MDETLPDLAFIGFGEAGMAFAEGIDAAIIAYDIKTDDPALAAAKRADYDARGVRAAATNAEACAAPLILSLVTADAALSAARDTARSIVRDAMFFDMNSVAPDTKRAARDSIEAAGSRYVDVAVMAPVHPARLGVPLLVSGPHATVAVSMLGTLGFSARAVGRAVGDASAIKMIRSVMVKGLEALTAEFILAADTAGVIDEAVASLNASWPGTDWAAKADYNLDRMLIHGARRAAEVEEVVKTLDSLGTGSAMTRGTVEWQRALGAIGRGAPELLADKIGLIAMRAAKAA